MIRFLEGLWGRRGRVSEVSVRKEEGRERERREII